MYSSCELSKVFQETKIEYVSLRILQAMMRAMCLFMISALKDRIDIPYTYIYDKKNKVFITDISYYDESCVPEGGQLLQAISYLNQEDSRE